MLAFGGIGFWSTNALAGSTALQSLDIGIVLVLQFCSATAALAVIHLLRAPRGRTAAEPLTRRDYWTGAFVGIIGFAGTQTTQYLGFAYAPIVESNIIAYGWPMFAAVWLVLVTRTRGTLTGFALSVLGFLGVALMTVGQNESSGTGSGWGYAAALASAFCMAFYTLAAGRVRASASYVMLCGGGVGIVIAFAIALLSDTDWNPSTAWAAMAYVGIGPCAAGFLLWSLGMSRSRGRLAPLGYATPVLSTLVLLAAGRSFGGPAAFLGAVLVLLCTVGVLINDRVNGEGGL
nr:DMT family transporter [Streptomyces sp. HNM0574]